MNAPQAEFRALCLRCRRAQSACFCAHLSPIPSRARVMLLQHPRESRNPMGTARMAHLQLPGSMLRIGIDFSTDAEVQAWLGQDPGVPTAVLYPARHARDAEELRRHQGPINLIALDGTWFQAKKLWQRNPWLHALPAYRLNPTEPGRYRIRKEPEPHCLSTVEALSQVLDVVEDEAGRHAPLLRPFDALVDLQLGFAGAPNRRPRHIRKVPKPKKPRPADPALAANVDNLLLVHGEGNGFSAHAHMGGPRPQLLVWTALRPATGERFEAVLDVGGEYGADALFRMGLDAAALARAMSAPAFVEAWNAFVRPQDTWVAWGTHGINLLLARGVGIPEAGVLNAQKMLHVRTFEKLGTLEAATTRLHLTAPEPSWLGRGARRLEVLAQVVARLSVPG